jgi:hypothetical protein
MRWPQTTGDEFPLPGTGRRFAESDKPLTAIEKIILH